LNFEGLLHPSTFFCFSRGDLGQYDFSIDVSGNRPAPKAALTTATSTPMSSLSKALEGFSLATNKSTIKKHFDPPAVPRDWQPSKTPTARKSRFEPAAETAVPAPTIAQPAGGTNPSRDQRRAVLFPDEANRRGQTIPEDLKQDVEAVEDKLPDFLTSVETKAGGPVSAAAATAGSFRPFANNADKQKRYEQYLVCLQNNRKDALKLLQPKAMTEWERERERVEFERAAVLYQPMKAVISSRFVSAGSEEDGAGKSGKYFFVVVLDLDFGYYYFSFRVSITGLNFFKYLGIIKMKSCRSYEFLFIFFYLNSNPLHLQLFC